ncbi:SMR family transporter [Alphaproteobacteria bacterium]|nr:SMR family transporter [Alphaproteobacteria bacterium]
MILYSYFYLLVAVVFGTLANSFAKSSEGFTKISPSLASSITIILCMFALSNVMKNIPMGITYASFAGLCILATSIVGLIRYGQIPNLYSMIGLFLIISGVLIVNLLGRNS